jgi:hypothetical protein
MAEMSGLDCLSFFLDFVSAMPRISLSQFIPLPCTITLFLQLQILQMNLSTCCVAFRWHHMVEISKLNKSNKNHHKCG